MKIVPNQDFKHDRLYEEGKEYDVSEEDAEYFQSAGWVGDKPETGIEQSLDIHDGILGHLSEVN